MNRWLNKEKSLEAERIMNNFGRTNTPFVFIIDFLSEKPIIIPFSELESGKLYFDFPKLNHLPGQSEPLPEKIEFAAITPDEDHYRKAYKIVQHGLKHGDSYLLNLTMPTAIKTNLTLENLFTHSEARYKVYLADTMVCFSPETFISINSKGIIASHPMKGTIDASVPEAAIRLQQDPKEKAEHYTIVDLIRNDLSLVAEKVRVNRFAYITPIKARGKELLQMSSEISGILPTSWKEAIGSILYKLLPAGSISGAPKEKTIEIIQEAEGYRRGYYTGVAGYFDGETLDSCVMIRYIEMSDEGLFFKSGGGITINSDIKTEWEELLQKIYVTIS